MKKYKFGIIGPGKIANRFGEALQTVPRAELYAVASRDEEKAKQYAAKFGMKKIYGSYEALAQDPDVDVVYIATPHTFHHAHTLLCLNNRKAVLCEKPLTLSKKLAEEMVAAARENKTFLMEAMWTRFIPAIIEAKRLVDKNEIGPVQFLRGDFGFVAPHNMENRVFNMKLGGGAQLDVGIYPMFLALLLLGSPKEISAIANKAETGADATTAALLKFKSGAIAHILSSIVSDSPKDAVIMGTLGTITLHTPWHKSMALTVRKNDGTEEKLKFPYESNGLQFQAIEVIRCLDEKLIESPLLPWSMSLLMAETADEILNQVGVRYPVTS